MYVIFPFCTGVLRATASLSSYLFYWSPCVIILSSCVIILFVPNPGKWEGEASMSTCRTTFHLNTPEGSPWKDVTGRRNQTSMKGRDVATESDLSNLSHARRKPLVSELKIIGRLYKDFACIFAPQGNWHTVGKEILCRLRWYVFAMRKHEESWPKIGGFTPKLTFFVNGHPK